MSDEGSPPRRRPRPYERTTRPRVRDWTTYLPLVSLIAFLTAIGVTIIALSSWLSPAGDPVTVPDFIGMSYDAASAAADGAHLRLQIIARRPEYHAAKDVVVGQLPAAA